MNWSKEILKKQLEHLNAQKKGRLNITDSWVNGIWLQGFQNYTQVEVLRAIDDLVFSTKPLGSNPIPDIIKIINYHRKKKPDYSEPEPGQRIEFSEAELFSKATNLALKLRAERKINYDKWASKITEIMAKDTSDWTKTLEKELKHLQDIDTIPKPNPPPKPKWMES